MGRKLTDREKMFNKASRATLGAVRCAFCGSYVYKHDDFGALETKRKNVMVWHEGCYPCKDYAALDAITQEEFERVESITTGNHADKPKKPKQAKKPKADKPVITVTTATIDITPDGVKATPIESHVVETVGIIMTVESISERFAGNNVTVSQKRGAGSCIWVAGDTKPIKDELKELGFKWSAKKSAWWAK